MQDDTSTTSSPPCDEDLFPVDLCFGMFVVGTTWSFLIIFFWIWGACTCRPYRHPRAPGAVLMLVLAVFVMEVWRLPHTPLADLSKKHLSPALHVEFTAFNLLEMILLWILMVVGICGWRMVNVPITRELLMLDMVKNAMHKENSVRGLHRQISTLEAKKKHALATELALAVDAVSHYASAHPVLVACCMRRRLKNTRKAILSICRVCRGNHILDFALIRTNVALLLAFACKETVTLIREASTDDEFWARDSKAVLLDALQKNGRMLRQHREWQEWVTELLISTSGPDLMNIKNILDGGGDYHSLRKLIYHDIRHKDLREMILSHFAEQRENCQGRDRGLMRKVLSDIDDTLYSSGGHFPAGCDRRFPKHAVYPGLLKLFNELDMQFNMTNLLKNTVFMKRSQDRASSFGSMGQGAADASREMEGWTNLIFLSARPHLYKDVTERVSYRLFHQLNAEGRLHAMPTLVPGKLKVAAGAAIRGFFGKYDAWEQVGRVKFESIRQLRALYPGYDFVFFGDNGQGDLLAAELALQEKLVSVAFINEVLAPRERSLTIFRDLPPEAREAKWKEIGICWTKTSVDAAVECLQRGLILDAALGRICESAKGDLEAIAIRWPGFEWRDRCDELNRSLDDARRYRSSITPLDTAELIREVRRIEKQSEMADRGSVVGSWVNAKNSWAGSWVPAAPEPMLSASVSGETDMALLEAGEFPAVLETDLGDTEPLTMSAMKIPDAPPLSPSHLTARSSAPALLVNEQSPISMRSAPASIVTPGSAQRFGQRRASKRR